MLSVTKISNVTVTFFSIVAQLSSRFTKDTSCSDPLNSRISIASRWFNKSSSVFQFDGWSQMQPDEHAVCAWNEEHVLVKLWLILHHPHKKRGTSKLIRLPEYFKICHQNLTNGELWLFCANNMIFLEKWSKITESSRSACVVSTSGLRSLGRGW